MAEISEDARKLQENLRGISGVPTLSTLAQKGDEKVSCVVASQRIDKLHAKLIFLRHRLHLHGYIV